MPKQNRLKKTRKRGGGVLDGIRSFFGVSGAPTQLPPIERKKYVTQSFAKLRNVSRSAKRLQSSQASTSMNVLLPRAQSSVASIIPRNRHTGWTKKASRFERLPPTILTPEQEQQSAQEEESATNAAQTLPLIEEEESVTEESATPASSIAPVQSPTGLTGMFSSIAKSFTRPVESGRPTGRSRVKVVTRMSRPSLTLPLISRNDDINGCLKKCYREAKEKRATTRGGSKRKARRSHHRRR